MIRPLSVLSYLILILCMPTMPLISTERPARVIPPGGNPQERFLKLLDRPRVPLAAKTRQPIVEDGVSITPFEFDSEKGKRVPGIQVSPAHTTANRLPVVIVLHGTGGNKQLMLPILKAFAARGVIGVAIDGRYAGERSGGASGTDAYMTAIFECWKSGTEFPFYYDTAWDMMRLLDYLETRPDIDAKRIGGIGFSKGGTELYLAASVDDRIFAAVPCIGVQSFGWALENNAWQSRIGTIQSAMNLVADDAGISRIDDNFVRRFYDRVTPGIYREFDGPIMLPMIAPRPLLIINGARDDRTPGPGLELCIAATRQAYERLNAKQNLEFINQPDTGHAVTMENQGYAITWLVKQLTAAIPKP